jgi:hypothetical protein
MSRSPPQRNSPGVGMAAFGLGRLHKGKDGEKAAALRQACNAAVSA